MLTTTQVDRELLGLIEYIETGLLAPSLQRRLGHFPAGDLKMALRDLLDWLSLRGILRGRSEGPRGEVHPLTGRVVAVLPGLAQYVCVPDGRPTYRVEVPRASREELEDFVMDRIWHPHGAARRALAREGAWPMKDGDLEGIGEPVNSN